MAIFRTRTILRNICAAVLTILALVSLQTLGTILLVKDPVTIEKKSSVAKCSLEEVSLLQSDVKNDFPTVADDRNGKPRIPHIIHQTFKNESIPVQFSDFVKSFIENHSNWTYYFWSDASARKLIERRHPNLLEVWDAYPRNIQRSDMLRYVVLYEFGGIYADLDIESLRPLDMATHKFPCIIPTEPFEHSVFLYGMPYLINNAFMMCRRKHPFFKQVLQNLVNVKNIEAKKANDVMSTTGPFYLTNQYDIYNSINASNLQEKSDNSSNSPYFFQGHLPEVHNDAVYVPNTRYFTDEIDIIQENVIRNKCKEKYLKQNCDKILIRRGCREVATKGIRRNSHRYRFVRHAWHHTWTSGNTASLRTNQFVNLSTLFEHQILSYT
ncbi:uncharacterized protein LOC128241426 [Mya arenaria]|uniref:uncharacterized protein LOC128241426 n=1 Tax=Mya arenaria TaxID=6604 RepID=UPI0022E10C0B|nr:uncharacterized protein LOC128241426 [Mya arenaria]